MRDKFDITDLSGANIDLSIEELKRVKIFLVRFGFWPHTEKGTSAFRRAIDNLRALYRIPVDSEFGPEVIEIIDRPRCGSFRFSRAMLASDGCVREGLCHNSRTLRYAFVAGFSGDPEANEFAAVRSAFDAWESLGDIEFIRRKPEEEVDIRVEWRFSRDDHDLNMEGSVIAHSDFPGKCARVVAGIPKPIHFDKDHSWGIDRDFDVQTVALHEIGHILGLE